MCQPVKFCQFLGSASFDTFHRQVFVDNSHDRTPWHASFSYNLPCWPMCSGFVFLTDNEVFNGIDVLRRACWKSLATTNLPFHSTRLTKFLQQIIQSFSVRVLIRKLLNNISCTVAFGFPKVLIKILSSLLNTIINTQNKQMHMTSHRRHKIAQWENTSNSNYWCLNVRY